VISTLSPFRRSLYDLVERSDLLESQKELLFSLLFFQKNSLKVIKTPKEHVPLSVQWLKDPLLSESIHQLAGSEASVFYSSGTSHSLLTSIPSTSLVQAKGRSKSVFSRAGLFMYRIGSLWHFMDILERSGYPVEDFHGVSLIPQPSQWKHSSLATMIAWFGEHFPLTYVDSVDELKELLGSTKKAGVPTWVFGTAAHYLSDREDVNRLLKHRRYERNFAAKGLTAENQALCHSHLFAFETGGIKALQLSVAMDNRALREFLYRYIHTTFHIPLCHIGSEYSSCELASQAYSFCPKIHASYNLSYHFPSYVTLGVCEGMGKYSYNAEAYGKQGEMLLNDPLRIDIPYSLAMEDMIAVDSSGGFSVLARLSRHGLRGCSLRVSEVMQPVQSDELEKGDVFRSLYVSCPSDTQHKTHTKHTRPKELLGLNSGLVVSSLQVLFSSSAWWESLFDEFSDRDVARKAQRDLQFSVKEHCLESAFRRCGIQSFAAPGCSVLFIVPHNHSLACLYPVLLAALGGAKIYMRVPETFLSANVPLMHFLRWLKETFGVICQGVSSAFRLSQETLKSYQDWRFFVFGATATLSFLQGIIKPGYLAGFGTSCAVSVLFSPRVDSLLDVLADAYDLKQRGCMSAQMLILPQKSYKLFCEVISQMPPLSLSVEEGCLLEARRRDFVASNTAYKSAAGMLFSLYFRSQRDLLWTSLVTLVDDTPMSVPVVFLDSFSEIFFKHIEMWHKHQEMTLKYISTDNFAAFKNISTVTLRKPLQLGRQPWDGYFENRPLFKAL